MTSRERVLAVPRHQEADRVPIDLGAMRSSGIQAIAYNRLKAHLGIEGGQTVLYDIMQQLAQPEQTLIDRFQLDVLPLPRAVIGLDPCPAALEAVAFARRLAGARPGRPGAGASGRRRLRDTRRRGRTSSIVCLPPGCTTSRSTSRWRTPPPSPRSRHGSRRRSPTPSSPGWPPRPGGSRATTDKAIIGLTGQKIYEGAQVGARAGSVSWRTWPVSRRWPRRCCSGWPNAACADLARYLDAVGDCIDIVQVGDAPGSQNGPQLSPGTYSPARQAVPAADVAVHQGPQRPAGVSALLRRDLSAHPRPDRGGR